MPPPLTDPIAIEIIYPCNYSAVEGGGSFNAFGYVEPSGAVNRTAVITGAALPVPINGVVVPAHGPYNWEFQFAGVPVDVWVVLSVSAQHPFSNDVGAESHNIRCTNAPVIVEKGGATTASATKKKPAKKPPAKAKAKKKK